jgi:hypothetical protein
LLCRVKGSEENGTELAALERKGAGRADDGPPKKFFKRSSKNPRSF